MTKDEALQLIADIASGSRTANSLPNIERIAKEALEQREQDGECKYCTDGCPACDARKLPEQEPVAVVRWDDLGHISWRTHVMLSDDTPLYTTPPQRKPLTDEEIAETLTGYRLSDAIDITRAIEAAHGIKEST